MFDQDLDSYFQGVALNPRPSSEVLLEDPSSQEGRSKVQVAHALFTQKPSFSKLYKARLTLLGSVFGIQGLGCRWGMRKCIGAI